jgi:hypothetical protein
MSRPSRQQRFALAVQRQPIEVLLDQDRCDEPELAVEHTRSRRPARTWLSIPHMVAMVAIGQLILDRRPALLIAA